MNKISLYNKTITVKCDTKSDLLEIINNKIKQATECLGHGLFQVYLKTPRRYRRGKNRCKICGYEL